MKRGTVAALAGGTFAVAVVLPALAVGALAGSGATTKTSCNVTAASGVPLPHATGLTTEQQANANTIVEVGAQIPGVGQAGEVVAIDAAITESGLVNLPGGSGSSVGLFQQTSSWPGTAAEHMDPVWASTSFYTSLMVVPGWQQLPVWAAAQKVQRSGAGQASGGQSNYGPHVAEAQQIVGNQPAALTSCTPDGSVALPSGVNLPAPVVAGIRQADPQVQAAIAFGLRQLGCPYVWGGTGPCAKGFDCSGLTQMAYAAGGVTLGRTTFAQVLEGQPVAEADLQPGDLVLPDVGHIQIFLGGGLILEAPHTGAQIRVVPIWGFWAARRVA